MAWDKEQQNTPCWELERRAKSHQRNRQLQSRFWGPIKLRVVVVISVVGSRVVVVSSTGGTRIAVDVFFEGRDVGMVLVEGSVVVHIPAEGRVSGTQVGHSLLSSLTFDDFEKVTLRTMIYSFAVTPYTMTRRSPKHGASWRHRDKHMTLEASQDGRFRQSLSRNNSQTFCAAAESEMSTHVGSKL